jgi:hypothetical protein
VQPGTYGLIHRNLMRTHAASPSLTWAELEQFTSQAPPAPDDTEFRFGLQSASLAQSQAHGGPSAREFQFAVDIDGEKLAEVTARFSRSLRVHPLLQPLLRSDASAPTSFAPIDQVVMATRGRLNLAQLLGAVLCVRTPEFISRDMSVELVLHALRPGGDGGQPCREYHFAIWIGDEEVITFCASFNEARSIHKALLRDQQVAASIQSIPFPDRTADKVRDMTNNDANAARRGEELRVYYQQLLRVSQLLTVVEDFTTSPLETAEWKHRFLRSYAKVQEDPDLVRRAMLFLRLTGKVLHHQMAPPAMAAATDTPAQQQVIY